jgi:hypothetical protein
MAAHGGSSGRRCSDASIVRNLHVPVNAAHCRVPRGAATID